jgi:hypothetical protein
VSITWSSPEPIIGGRFQIGVDYECREVYQLVDTVSWTGRRRIEVKRLNESNNAWVSQYREELPNNPEEEDPTPAANAVKRILVDVRAFLLAERL